MARAPKPAATPEDTQTGSMTPPVSGVPDHAWWCAEIQTYEGDTADWCERAGKIIDRYKDKRAQPDTTRTRFNVLWSNVQTLQPALYGRTPKPDIARRFNDADPVGRTAARVLERCAAYYVATDGFDTAMRQTVLDYLLPGRGVAWVRYVPAASDLANAPEPGDGQVTDDLGPLQVGAYEDAVVDYVHWRDFGHTAGRVWEEVRGVWRIARLDRAQLIKRFGEKLGSSIPLDHGPKDAKGMPQPLAAKATIYEIWDSGSRTAIWLHKDVKQLLDVRPDPLRLDKFFPCPRPLFANLANDDLVPVPDYIQYQDQARELDDLTQRIASITKSLKVAGVYDSSAQALQRLLNEGVENQLIPVDQWSMFAEKGGLKGVIDFLPIADIVQALLRLYEARAQVKADLYEISGIADIIRGSTVASETATAQQIKSNFATLRLSDRQQEVQRFARDLVRIITQIVAEQFSLDTIKQISGIRLLTAAERDAVQAMLAQPPMPAGGAPAETPDPAALQTQMLAQAAQALGVEPDTLDDLLVEPTWEEVEALIRNEAVRCFRIDIETDSTIKSDQQQEKADRVEFLTAAGGFLEKAVLAGQQVPQMTPLLMQMLMFGVRAFPVGKELESAFQVTARKLERAASQPQQAGPDPEMLKLQAEMQRDQMREQAETERFAIKQQAENQRLMHAEEQRNQLEIAREQIRAQTQRENAAVTAKMNADAKVAASSIDADAKVTQAAINAQAAAMQPRAAFAGGD